MKKKSERKGLNHVQLRTVLELVSPGNTSLTGIAQKVGVTTRTLNNWLRNQEFQEALKEAMDELKKNALDSSLFAVHIEALSTMVKHELQVVEDFEIKGAIVELGEKQALLERKVKEISEELKSLRSILSELRNELLDSGN